jgi:MFS transporter, DHA1 family, staphyloferrin A biosynthesis exporter
MSGEQPPPGSPGRPGAGDIVRPGRWSTTFASLKEPEYAWYFAGNIAFFMGMQMQFVLRGFLAYELTGKATALAMVSLAIAIPMLVVAPFGGVVADRVNKRNLLIASQSVAAMASLVTALLILTDLIEFWHLLAVSFVTGVVFSFNMPARQALVPNLVPQHKLMNAISLQMGGMNLTRIIAPAMAGLLIAPLGMGWVYMLTTALFTLAVLSEFHLPAHGMRTNGERKSFRQDLGGGFRYILDDPLLRLLMAVALIMPLFAFPIQQLLPVFAKDVFSDGTEERAAVVLGVLAAASGLGGLSGAIVSANMDTQPAKGRLMFIGGMLMGVFLLAFAWSPYFLLALFFLAAMGVGQMIFQVTNNTVIQAELPGEIRGRVMSVLMMSFGIMPLGVLPVSVAADALGPRAAVAMSSCVLLGTMIAIWTLSARLRNLRLDRLRQAQLSNVQAAVLVAEGKLTQEDADRLTGETDRRMRMEEARRQRTRAR